jgi:hypothetical protein
MKDLSDKQILEKLQQLQNSHREAQALKKRDSIRELIDNVIPKPADVQPQDSVRIFAAYQKSRSRDTTWSAATWTWVSARWNFPAVVLRPVQGTLMLSSNPPGAAVLVNGKRQPQVTPAQFQLAPGSYSISVEWKDGKQASRTVQIKDGINFQKFLIGQ